MEPYQLKCHNHKCDKQPNSDITSYSASYYRCKSNHHVFCSEKCKLEFDLIKCNRCGYNEQWNKQFKGKYYCVNYPGEIACYHRQLLKTIGCIFCKTKYNDDMKDDDILYDVTDDDRIFVCQDCKTVVYQKK